MGQCGWNLGKTYTLLTMTSSSLTFERTRRCVNDGAERPCARVSLHRRDFELAL